MNANHLRTFVWLRYRLLVNQLRRGGIGNTIVLAVLAAAVAAAAAGLFAGGLLVGLFALPAAPPPVRLLAWDGVALFFLFVWMIGLMTELQRTDGLTPDKFLHLPVAPAGAFVVNYFSSLVSVSLTLFLPGAVGLILGQAVAEGPLVLLAFPLLAAFVFAVTAVTYQFQGWLASLMTNPRKRRTVIVAVTMSFVLVAQLPNLFNVVVRPWKFSDASEPSKQYVARLRELDEASKAGKLSSEEYQRLSAEAQQTYQSAREESKQRVWDEVEHFARAANVVLPPGWLPLGAADLAGGRVLPALLGGSGLTLIGAVALLRAYRTTLRMFTGADHGGGGGRPAAAAAAGPPGPEKVRLVEWRIPGIPEPAAAVAAAGLRSLLRAPEAKITLIVPVILVVVFGSLFFSLGATPPADLRPLIAFGAVSLVLLSLVQIAGNQFGFDRGGFRAFVLGPLPRHDILFGKNLALAPLAFSLIGVALVGLECVCPMRVDHFLAALVQAAGMYLLMCLMTNAVSILTPLPVAAGATKPTQLKIGPVLAQFALLAAYPVVTAPLLFPLGVELLLAEVTGVSPLPVALPLEVGMVAGVVFVYRRGLVFLGRLLADREQHVLAVVTANAE